MNALNSVASFSSTRLDFIGDGAFEGFIGIAQINQSSGFGNNQAQFLSIGVSTGLGSPSAP